MGPNSWSGSQPYSKTLTCSKESTILAQSDGPRLAGGLLRRKNGSSQTPLWLRYFIVTDLPYSYLAPVAYRSAYSSIYACANMVCPEGVDILQSLDERIRILIVSSVGMYRLSSRAVDVDIGGS